MFRHLRLLVLCLGSVLPLLASAGSVPPAPSQWVTDNAAFMSAPAASRLNDQLQAYENQTGHQIIVWIGKTSGNDPIEDFAAKSFAAWRVGRNKYDDGIVLFIMSQDRTARIEVGYGLEDKVPDAAASRILREVLIPRIKAGDRDGAVEAAVRQLVAQVGQPSAATPAGGSVTTGEAILGFFAVIAFIILIWRFPALGYWLLWAILNSKGNGGRGSRYSGGGGRSGGGGASGRW